MLHEGPGPARMLGVQPVLESWDRAGSPGQVRLGAFLDTLKEWQDDLPGEVPLALDLVVGLPPAMSLTSGGNDLDNYLLPIVRRLGQERFYAVFGSKGRGSSP